MHYLYRYICILKVFYICIVYGQLSAIKNLLYYYYYNGIVEVCTLNARSNANSPMGSILSFCVLNMIIPYNIVSHIALKWPLQ